MDVTNNPHTPETGHTPPNTPDGSADAQQPKLTRTPFFEASHASRYQRQTLIKKIQERTGRLLICYVSGPACLIDRDDTIAFVDLLHNVPPQRDLDLLLHTGGGDIDAAEKLISMLRNRVGSAELRIVVPDYAKSAGTLMVLGADRVVMSDTSELGPIDPQVVLSDGKGNRIPHSVQCYLDAYEQHTETLQRDPDNAAAQIMLAKLDPATIKLFEAVRDRARKFAEDQLKKGMFRNDGNWSLAASALLNTKRWQSHGQMISWEDAQDPKIGLAVEYLEPKSEAWQDYWLLYCLQRLGAQDGQKLFESDYASLLLDAPTA